MWEIFVTEKKGYQEKPNSMNKRILKGHLFEKFLSQEKLVQR